MKTPTLEERNMIAQLTEALQIKLRNNSYIVAENDHEYVNFMQLIEDQELYTLFNDELMKETDFHIKFWMKFLENEPKIIELYKISTEIDIQNKETRHKWGEMVNFKDKSSSKLILLYGLYNMIVKNRTIYGQKYVKFYNNLIFNHKNDVNIDKLTKDNILSPDNILVMISGQKENLGIIESISRSIESHYGFTAESLINNNITALMSSFYEKRHTKFLIRYYRTGEENFMNNRKLLYIKHVNGYCIPVKILIKYFPYIRNGVSFIGLIRPIRNYKESITIEMNGTIDSFTKKIGQMLGLHMNRDGNKREINIKELCPQLEEVNKILNEVMLKKLEDSKKKEFKNIILKKQTFITLDTRTLSTEKHA